MSLVASKVLSDVPQSWIIYEWPKYFWQNGFESKLFKLEGTLTLSSWPGIYAEIFFFSLHILIFSTVAYVRWYFSHFSKRILCIFHCLSPKNPSRHLFPQHFFQDSKDASASTDTQPGGFVETTLVCSVSLAGVRLLKCGGALWGCEAERQLWIFLSNESPPPIPPPTPTLARQWAAGASSLKLLAGDAKLKAIPIHCRLCCVGTMSSSSEILLSPNPSDFSPRSSVPPPASSHTVNPAGILGEQRAVFLFLKKSVTKDPCNTWKMAQGWDLGHTLRTAGLVRGSPCALANGLGTASEGLGPVNIDFDVQIFYWIVVHWYKVFIGSWQ